VGFHLFDQLLVQHVALGDGQQTLLVEQFGIVLRQFAQQDFVIAPDVVAVGEKFRDLLPIKEALISSERFEVPGWLEVDIEKLSGNVLALPTREQISGDINEQLIVELYSK